MVSSGSVGVATLLVPPSLEWISAEIETGKET